MTRDSGSERPQRTVAELLAEYGGTGSDAPRRRRRRAEDDGDSAPQTIIERVLSDSGKLLPIRDDQPAPEAPRRGGGHRSGEPRQPVQQPTQLPPQPVKPPAGGPPPGQPTAYAEPVRPTNPATGRQPMPPRAPGPPPQQPPSPSQQSGQFPPSRPGMPPVGPPTTAVRPVQQPGQPGLGQPGQAPGPQSRPGMSPVSRPLGSRPGGSQRLPVPSVDEAVTAVHPPLPDDFDYPPAQPPTMLQAPVPPARPSGLPPDAGVTEEFPPVPGEPSGPLRPAPPGGRQGPGMPPGPTQLVPPVGPPGRRPPAGPALESTQAHAGPYVEDSASGFPPVGAEPGQDLAGQDIFPSRDDFDDDDSPSVKRVDFDDAEDAGSVSPGREWFMMGAQVGAGAIAGAAVWLAFSWLWGLQPVLAVVLALGVIVGLVLGVRRWRRAEDLQTTVLAILAGLVVTVSPAALLLLHR